MADLQHDEKLDLVSILILSVILGAVGVVIYLLMFKKESKDEEDDIKSKVEEVKSESSKKNTQIQQPPKKKTVMKKDSSLSNHPLLHASLKGHTGTVFDIDLSSNGKFLASCAEDRTVRLWNVKDLANKDHRYSRVNVEFDHATSVSVSPDSKAFIVSLALEKTIRVYKIMKKKEEGAMASSLSFSQEFDFPVHHRAELISVAISSSGKYIMSADKDKQIIIWSLKGEVLDKIDTLLVYNSQASVSPCGNLVAACGFTSDVKMWHVKFQKNGDFNQVVKGLELKGHSAGVLSFSFANDSKRMASVSKDGTWKVWDIDVDYLKGQDAYLLHTGSYQPDDVMTRISLSHDYFTVAVSVGTALYLYDTNNQELGESVENAHTGDITALQWHSESKQLVSAGGSDRSIKVWHNPVGVKACLRDLLEKLPKAKNNSMKERIQQQIEECRKYLSTLQK